MQRCPLQRGAEHVWGRGTPTTTKLQQQYKSRDMQPTLEYACFEVRAGSIEGQVVRTSSEHIGAPVA